jgi:hypothetical protein
MYRMLEANGSTIPKEGLAMVRTLRQLPPRSGSTHGPM